MANLYGTKTAGDTSLGNYSIKLSNSSGTLYNPETTWQQKLGESSDRRLFIKYTCNSGLVLPANCRYLFSFADSVWSTRTNIANFTSIDTSEVENMNYMFYYADLRFLTFAHFNTSNVTNMARMFEHAHHALNVNNGYDMATDLSSFDTSKVETMNHMFYGTNIAAPLGINGGDISNVDDFQYMFSQATFGVTNDPNGYHPTSIEHNGLYAGENIDWSRQIKPTAITTDMCMNTSGYNGKWAKSANYPYGINAANSGSSGVFWGNAANFGDPYDVFYYDSEFTPYDIFEKVDDNGEGVDSVYVKTSL